MHGEHGTWKLLNTSVEAEVVNGIYRSTLTFRLERKSLYVIVNIILPIMFLSILNVLVFMLPAESGERVSYAITVLLAITVFMTIITDTMPKKSEPLPLISYFLMIDLIVSALTSLFTILNLRIYHKDDDTLVPRWIQSVYRLLIKENNRRKIYEAGNRKNQQDVAFENEIAAKEPSCNLAGQKGNSRNSKENRIEIRWKDISKLLDYILLILFSLITFTSLIVFLVITQFN